MDLPQYGHLLTLPFCLTSILKPCSSKMELQLLQTRNGVPFLTGKKGNEKEAQILIHPFKIDL